MKKAPGDIIILHDNTKNHDHMHYCFWDMACDGCNCYFSFWAIFCPFTPLTVQKMKIKKKKKKKKHHHFTEVYQKSWSYTILFLRHDVTDVIIIFHFGLFFALLAPLTTRKIKISIKWKIFLEISLFYTCVPKIMIRWCTVPEIWCTTDGQMDEQKKWHIEVGAPPRKKLWHWKGP